MKNLLFFLNRYRVLLIAVLKPLGIWGVFCLAAVDASALGLPLDFIVGGFLWNDRSRVLLYCLMAAAGSALGSLVPYAIGRAGGEVFLLKRTNRKRFDQLRDRFEKQEFLALMVPAVLPPPTPFKLFVFSAGVFGMRPFLFLLAIFTGRVLRFFLLALLIFRFGPSALPLVAQAMERHIATFLLILAIAALFGALRIRSKRKARLRRQVGQTEPI